MPLTFTLSPGCAGGEHYSVTLSLGSKSKTIHVTNSDFKEDMLPEELTQFAHLLLRFLVEQLQDRGVTNVRSKLNGASLTLDL